MSMHLNAEEIEILEALVLLI